MHIGRGYMTAEKGLLKEKDARIIEKVGTLNPVRIGHADMFSLVVSKIEVVPAQGIFLQKRAL
jgi:ribosomal protein S16